MIELIDQLADQERNNNKKLINPYKEILSQIKGISNYLLILVKDIDFFSQSQSKISCNIENEKCNLEEIISFIRDIVIILLKKANKNEKITFIVEKDSNLNNFLTTDEVKLKQILINLLSNAIKFTHKGKIILQMTSDPDNISGVVFTVKDTGIGMDVNQQNFSLFKKSNDRENVMGTGLGLFIIKELTSQLGTQIKIKSELGKGSLFTFTVKNLDFSPLKNMNFQENEKVQMLNKNNLKMRFHKKLSINSTNGAMVHDQYRLESSLFNKNMNSNNNSNHVNYNLSSIKKKSSFDIPKSFVFQLSKSNSANISEITKKLSSTYVFLKDRIFSLNDNESQSLDNGDKMEKNNIISISNNSGRKGSSGSFSFDPRISVYKPDKFKAKENLDENHISILVENDLDSKRESLRDINIIICDDEELTRKSSIRMIKKNFELNHLNKYFELKFYEARDGIDSLANFYNLLMAGKDIFCIVSDESMYCMNGSECAAILDKIIDKTNIFRFPFYLITAFPKEKFDNLLKNSITNVFSKPIKFQEVNIIFKNLLH